MGDYINRLKRTIPRTSGYGTCSKERVSDLPLDHRLSFYPSFDEKWTFDEERWIRLNDVSVEEMLADGGDDIQLLCGLSHGLGGYQQHVWTKGGKSLEKFNGVVNALQNKIFGKLGKIYDAITGGVRFESNGEDFWINNINVRSVLNLYRLRPTQKARQYLWGLRDKLGLILSRRQSSTMYDGISKQARELFDEISLALEYIPADAPLCLGAGSGDA